MTKNFLLIATLCLITISGCKARNVIMTVSGPIPVEKMGTTLTHEHIIVDFAGADKIKPSNYNMDSIEEIVMPYLIDAKERGLNTFVDCTPAFLGRNVILIKQLSEKSGLNIITNTGLYAAIDNKYLPDHVNIIAAEELAENWINEFKNGINRTDIKPGFIKISVNGTQSIDKIDEKIVTAAAITHKKTGLVIASHTTGFGAFRAQFEILREKRVKPRAFIWAHSQTGSDEQIIEAAKMGCWVSIDNINNDLEIIDRTMKLIQKLKDEDLLDRVLISQDAGWYDVQEKGKNRFRPYTTIFTEFIPALKLNGFEQEDIDLILVDNPARAFMIKS